MNMFLLCGRCAGITFPPADEDEFRRRFKESERKCRIGNKKGGEETKKKERKREGRNINGREGVEETLL